MIHLGLIGCGEHSESGHAVPLARYKAAYPGEIELAAACDIRAERARGFCERYGFSRGYTDVDEMLQKEHLDGCFAVVPTENIPELGIKLLRRGVPCVVEKPLGPSLEQVKLLVEAARQTPTPSMVSVNRRFMPFLHRALEWSYRLGPLRYVRATMVRHARTEPEFLWTTAVHAVDALRHIAGNVAEGHIRNLGKGNGAWFGIDLLFTSGVAGCLEILPTAGMLEETYELAGDGFRASVTAPFGSPRRWQAFKNGGMVAEEIAPESMEEDKVNGCYDETSEFIQALTNKRAPRPSIAEVFPSVELCFALAKSVENNFVQS